ncbi:UDP-2,4-diacetamido-2,4,6-trideoxy-beta-L-altropyranose hydrolase [Azospirillum brasilense]|uniref:UDP-2,4-diacetamido-2,4, 6-trideoxy-beta-L-altropyranose hydrolase n=1 Tax=Azospirillum brasilense TaxID=192 RepID=A0A560CRE8_AZOBR|nr:UDP-2,4-diacetamido-2,4,6-trideoxy-beta-L-altropyranose hydrolase [Azospirillum brasilense]TWA87434.1 UDP-2,4-diacetamido-2,4,6-trideoxy-beta-L-altropyranose hydrolase [Azospirillum brasilense]
MRVLFRADAGASIGAGHVMRCLAVAEAVQELGGDALFAAASLPSALEERLRAAGMAVHRTDAAPGSAADLAATRAIAVEAGTTAIVLDGYGFSDGWRAGLAETGLPILAFDDAGTGEPIHAGLIVNAAPDAASLPYHKGNPDARLLLGPAHAPLRREVREAATAAKPPLEERHSLLVTFGGSDPLGLTAPVIERLAPRLPPGVWLDVAIGGAVRDAAAVEAAAGRFKDSVRLHRDTPRMGQLMAQAGLAVSAAGTTTGELAAIGTPAVLVTIADNQLEAARQSEALGWCALVPGQTEGAPERIADVALELWADPARRGTMAGKLAGIVDGQGALRIARALAEAVINSGARINPLPSGERGG